MRFLGRWLGDALRFVLVLAGAVLFMQAPAVTHDYLAGLQQVADAESRDIANREATARGFYGLQSASEADLLSALRQREPSNAAGLEQTRDQSTALSDAVGQLERSSPLWRPVLAVLDLLSTPDTGKEAVAEQAILSFAPQLQFSAAALVWALIGILAGSFLAQLLLLPARRRAYA